MNNNMKRLYNEKVRLVKLTNDIGAMLDKKIQERFGFHYSQTDYDPFIDTLDYGTDNLEYKDFIQIMNEYKDRIEKED